MPYFEEMTAVPYAEAAAFARARAGAEHPARAGYVCVRVEWPDLPGLPVPEGCVLACVRYQRRLRAGGAGG